MENSEALEPKTQTYMERWESRVISALREYEDKPEYRLLANEAWRMLEEIKLLQENANRLEAENAKLQRERVASGMEIHRLEKELTRVETQAKLNRLVPPESFIILEIQNQYTKDADRHARWNWKATSDGNPDKRLERWEVRTSVKEDIIAELGNQEDAEEIADEHNAIPVLLGYIEKLKYDLAMVKPHKKLKA